MSAAENARTASPEPDFSGDLEQRLVSQIFQDPSKVEQVIATVGLSDFTNATAAKTLAAMRRLVDAGGSVTLAAVGDELNRVGDLGSIGGPVALAEIFDLEASAVGLLDAARGVRLRSLRRRERLLHVQASQGDRIENARDELLKVEGELAALEGGAQADLPDLTFSGSRLESVRDRDEPTSPLPGLFDPEPGLHVFVGQSSQGKTTLALHVGQSWSCGVEPWEGAPRLPGSPVLFISREQSVRRIDRRARVLDTQNSRITRQAWTDRLLIVARDRDLPRALCPLLRLDEKGLPLLRQLLQQAKDDGDPIGLVVLDSLSRLKPAGMSESDNDDMADWLDELHGMSEETDAYFLLIHHKGHVERDGDRGAGRGASAIDAVAQATWDLRRVPGEQAFRELRVYGNGVDDSTRTFRVAPDCDPGKVMFWRLEGPDDAMKPEDHLTPGEAITTEDLAWKLSGKIRSATGSNGRRARAPRDAQIRAAAARDRWEAEGRISISTGLHNAKLITLATENLEPEAQKNAVAF